jgi:hypothetical protein
MSILRSAPPPCLNPCRCILITSLIPAPNAKTREAHKALRGFRSGCISPVDFVLMPQQKEQIKNFLKKLYIPPKAAPSGPVFILAHARS